MIPAGHATGDTSSDVNCDATGAEAAHTPHATTPADQTCVTVNPLDIPVLQS